MNKYHFTTVSILILGLVGCTSSKFTVEEHQEFFRTLANPGDGEQNEYGWICEYSTAGFPPDQRYATLALVKDKRVDLLREALRPATFEGQIYATDALLYLNNKGTIKLSSEDNEMINKLRQSNEEVRTCGNMGSYKLYLVPANEVLSDSAVARIPQNYENMFEYLFW